MDVSYLGSNEFVPISCSVVFLGFSGHTHGGSPGFSVPASMAISVFLETDHVACVWQKQVLVHEITITETSVEVAYTF